MLKQREQDLFPRLWANSLRGMRAPIQVIITDSGVRLHGQKFVGEEPEQLVSAKLSHLMIPIRSFIFPCCQAQGPFCQLPQICHLEVCGGILAHRVFDCKE
jgi:hypothetical protein